MVLVLSVPHTFEKFPWLTCFVLVACFARWCRQQAGRRDYTSPAKSAGIDRRSWSVEFRYIRLLRLCFQIDNPFENACSLQFMWASALKPQPVFNAINWWPLSVCCSSIWHYNISASHWLFDFSHRLASTETICNSFNLVSSIIRNTWSLAANHMMSQFSVAYNCF